LHSRSIKRKAIKYAILLVVIIASGFLLNSLYDIYGLTYHRHLLATLFSIVLISFILFFLFFLIRRIVTPLNTLAKVFEEMTKSKFNLSSKNKTTLKKLSSYSDEVSTLINSFLKFERLYKQFRSQLRRSTRQREKLENSLAIAAGIQLSLLPNVPGMLSHPNIDLYALLESAEKVGGDWYDFFFLDDTSLFFVLGDVSDKGISAALFMAIVKTHLSSIVEFEKNPAKIVALLNKKLRANNPHHMFVTLFLGILNIETGELHYINAGHCTPILLQKNQAPFFLAESYQPIVGVLNELHYHSRKLVLNQHDILFVYSDGVLEATNKSNDMFLDKRLLNYLTQTRPQKVRTLIRSVYTEIKHFSKRKTPRDDISMLAISLKQKIDLTRKKFWLTLPASIDSVDKFISFTQQHLEKYRISGKRKNEITLTLEELLVNIVENAYAHGSSDLISVSFEYISGRKIQIQLTDYGKPFDPVLYIQKQKVSKKIAKRGYGLQFAHTFCDEMSYKRIQHKNILTLRFE
jgi:sigma-B regulation protein RsbU (phosphoserine phosphatase)